MSSLYKVLFEGTISKKAYVNSMLTLAVVCIIFFSALMFMNHRKSTTCDETITTSSKSLTPAPDVIVTLGANSPKGKAAPTAGQTIALFGVTAKDRDISLDNVWLELNGTWDYSSHGPMNIQIYRANEVGKERESATGEVYATGKIMYPDGELDAHNVPYYNIHRDIIISPGTVLQFRMNDDVAAGETAWFVVKADTQNIVGPDGKASLTVIIDETKSRSYPIASNTLMF